MELSQGVVSSMIQEDKSWRLSRPSMSRARSKELGFLRLWVEMSTALGIDNLDIESDSQVVVQAITKMDCPNWRYSYILRQCQGMWRDSFSITHIFRQANMVADSCADWAHTHQARKDYYTEKDLPSPIRRALLADRLGIRCYIP